MSIDEAWDILEDKCGVNEQTLRTVTSINGYSLDTLEGVLYAVTGYRNFEQLTDEDEEGEE